MTTHSTSEDAPATPEDAARSVLMVRPMAFHRNDVTRPSNRFQSEAPGRNADETAAAAKNEFNTVAAILTRSGVDVRVFNGRTTTRLPDEVFPNNWITTHPDGTAVLYPMMAWNRRPERRRDILEALQQQAEGFRIERLVDLTYLESENSFLEGSGSLVFDHSNRIAFACLSHRTHLKALKAFGRATGYGIVTFEARDRDGHAIYHTNVMLSVGERFAVVCLEAIAAVDERFRLLSRLERSGREVIELRLSQLNSFCGNIIQLRAGDQRIIAMSVRARDGFDDKQIEALSRHGRLLAVDVGTIERLGGGSVRCMLAELLLPRKSHLEGTLLPE